MNFSTGVEETSLTFKRNRGPGRAFLRVEAIIADHSLIINFWHRRFSDAHRKTRHAAF
jgi:hypothetical protein